MSDETYGPRALRALLGLPGGTTAIENALHEMLAKAWAEGHACGIVCAQSSRDFPDACPRNPYQQRETS